MATNRPDEDGEVLEVCPDCGAADLRNRNPVSPASPSDDSSRYRCGSCGHRFDQPDTRVPAGSRPGPGAGSSLAAKLAGMDPDDVGGGAGAK